MKVISGKYKGKKLNGYDLLGTRPTMDRVKESVFAMLQDYIKDSTILDLYSGSGNLGIEAISNGAKYAYLVDNNLNAIKVINSNLKELNIDNAYVYKDDASLMLSSFIKQGIKFDIIFLDPPYKTNELDKVLTIINDNISLLNDNALIVCETDICIDYLKYDKLITYKSKKYGQKSVNILKIKQ